MLSPSRLLNLLRSQGLGVICGQASVLLLGIGSVVITAKGQTVYARLSLDDLRFFFEHPSVWHLWFYALLGVMVVYALNTVLCTWQSVANKVRMRIKAPVAYAPAVMHLAFLAALLAHLVGGLFGGSLPRRMVGPAWTELPWEVRARTLGMEMEHHADGSFAGVQVAMELEVEGERRLATIGFNQPILLDATQKVLLIGGFQERPVAVRVATPAGACELLAGGPGCPVGAADLRLLGIEQPRGMEAVARFAVFTPGKHPPEQFGAWPGLTHQLSTGETVKLEAIEKRAFVAVNGREMPGNLWAILGTGLLGLGVLLFGRRWF